VSTNTGIGVENPGVAAPVADALTDILRAGARQLLAQAVEAEVTDFLAHHRQVMADGRSRVVRNGYRPERKIQTGIGSVEVTAPRVRDRAGDIRFTSAILPPYVRRTRSIETLLPWLYLKGLSTGDFGEALVALLGKDAPGLSASTISRLNRDFPLERGYGEYTGVNLAGRSKVFAASHTPCIHARCCIANARFRMGFRPSVVM